MFMSLARDITALPKVAKPRRRIARILLRLVVIPVFTLVIAWGTLAIYYSNAPQWLRPIAAGIFVASCIAILFCIKSPTRRLPAFAGVFTAVLIWWSLIPPSNSRNWQAD